MGKRNLKMFSSAGQSTSRQTKNLLSLKDDDSNLMAVLFIVSIDTLCAIYGMPTWSNVKGTLTKGKSVIRGATQKFPKFECRSLTT
jgi:hypothetical protein